MAIIFSGKKSSSKSKSKPTINQRRGLGLLGKHLIKSSKNSSTTGLFGVDMDAEDDELYYQQIIQENIKAKIYETIKLNGLRLNIRFIDFCPTYCLNENKNKVLKKLYLKRRIDKQFYCITHEEVVSTGASSEEFIGYLVGNFARRIPPEDFFNKI